VDEFGVSIASAVIAAFRGRGISDSAKQALLASFGPRLQWLITVSGTPEFAGQLGGDIWAKILRALRQLYERRRRWSHPKNPSTRYLTSY